MTRDQHLEFCRRCTKRAFDPQHGTVCSLTNRIADFETSCDNYEEDPTVKIEPVEVDPNPTPNHEIVSSLDSRTKEQLRDQQDLVYALVGGAASALVGALIWAIVTVATNYQIGFMAIGVGLLVGFSVRYFGAGIDQYFGFIGAAFALLGCALGNLLSQLIFIADAESLGYLQTLSLLNLDIITTIYLESFSPMDIFFYAIAAYEGYKFAFRHISEELLTNMAAGSSAPAPYTNLRLPIVIGLFVVLSVGGFFLSRGSEGPVAFYYESGAKMSSGSLSGGLEEGAWSYWYDNGNLFYEGFFVNGLQDSLWKYYDEEGSISSTGPFRKGLKHGLWTEYYATGEIAGTAMFQYGRMQGPSTQYHEDGAVSLQASYHLDRPDGEWVSFYPTGQVNYKGTYVRDKQQGSWTWWSEEGNKIQEFEYDNGELSILNSWSPEGKQEVLDGNGIYNAYDEDGAVLETGIVQNGKQSGLWKRFSVGELQEEGEYRNGTYYIKNAWAFGGKQSVKDGEGKYIGDSSPLLPVIEGPISQGLKTGLWTVTTPTGFISQEMHFADGKLNGMMKSYFENGEVSSGGEMKDDEREGHWVWYHEDGGIESEITYVNGKKEGEQLFYSNMGKVLRTEVYQGGELINTIVPD